MRRSSISRAVALAFMFFPMLSRAKPVKPKKPVVLFLGDSLTLGLGVDEGKSFPELVGKRWKRERKPWKARSFGILGGDSGDIRDYLDLNLTDDVGLVFLMIGENDGLNKNPPDKVRAHLIEIIEHLRTRGIPVAIAAMGARAGADREYAIAFNNIYPELARRYKIPMMPFPLRGIFDHAELTVDGSHPNEKGQRMLAERVYDFLDPSRLPR